VSSGRVVKEANAANGDIPSVGSLLDELENVTAPVLAEALRDADTLTCTRCISAGAEVT